MVFVANLINSTSTNLNDNDSTYIGLAFSLITAQTMFCEVGHLVMTSLHVNVAKVLKKCSPDEIPDVITQIQSTFDPD